MSHATDILLWQRQAERNAARRAGLFHLQPPEAPAAGGEAATLLWAQAAYPWHNAAGNGSYVDAFRCDDRTGANPQIGSTIRIYLPRTPGRDPNIVVDQVLGYIVDAAGANIAVVGYLDDAIGTVKLWSKTGTLPAGWVDCFSMQASSTVQSLSGSFPVGLKTGDSDFGTLGAFGNQNRKSHAHNMERDIPNPPNLPVWLDEGTWQTTHLSTALENHLPPWCVVRFIERINNAGA